MMSPYPCTNLSLRTTIEVALSFPISGGREDLGWQGNVCHRGDGEVVPFILCQQYTEDEHNVALTTRVQTCPSELPSIVSDRWLHRDEVAISFPISTGREDLR